MTDRLNCWEYKSCGREPGGHSEDELGTCPAMTDDKYHGVNRGSASGRFCWSVVGTFCKGEVQGAFANKLTNCLKCDFMVEVTNKEGRDFKLMLKDVGRKY